ncbi:MAG: Rossmann-like and DUF2520 domain-containing protein [Bacteroidales bacterium]|nr:Rossmann-like and DUF2520 domain-containing protein [Bacteroidales bacterium]
MYFRSLMKLESFKTVSIVGAGNVACNLGKALKNAGVGINSVFSRNLPKAEALAEKLDAAATDNLNDVQDSDMLILAVPDTAILWVAGKLDHKHNFMIHVSGSTSIDVLQPYAERYGVFYPLQTFSIFREVDFKEIPVCVEGGSEKDQKLLEQLASLITNDVRPVNSRQRLSIHLAAVFASNFVNYLNAEAADVLEKADVSRDILFPLMRETLNKMIAHHPSQTQTGPAVRKDHGTMTKHIDMLNMHPDKQKIYRILSEQIQRTFEK